MSDPSGLKIWLPRLAATVDRAVLDEVLTGRQWTQRSKVARDWSVDRTWAHILEISATAYGIEHDRVFELAGCMDSTAERFSLALAAGNEVSLWQKLRATARADPAVQGMHEMSQRAMAELFGYYLLGTGHMLAAIVLRALALEPKLRPSLFKQLRAPTDVQSTALPDWPSLNTQTCKKLRIVVRESDHDQQRDLAETISSIARDGSWKALDELRGEDYHRRRPSSAPLDSVPHGSAWQVSPGVRSLSIGAPRSTKHDNRAAEMSTVMFAVEQLLLDKLVSRE